MRPIVRTLVLTSALSATAGHVVMPAQSTCARGEPLTQDDVFKLVRAGVAEATVREPVAAFGVSFILDEKDAVSLANAGASRALIGVLAPPAAAAPGALWLAPTDSRQMVWAPEGSFQMGSAASEAGRK